MTIKYQFLPKFSVCINFLVKNYAILSYFLQYPIKTHVMHAFIPDFLRKNDKYAYIFLDFNKNPVKKHTLYRIFGNN